MVLKIKRILKERGISQKELATAVGMTEVGIYRMLKDEKARLDTLIKVAYALRLEVWQLFDGCPTGENFVCMMNKDGKQRTFKSEGSLRDFLGADE